MEGDLLGDFKRRKFGVSHKKMTSQDRKVSLCLDENYVVCYENLRENLKWMKALNKDDYPRVNLSKDGEKVIIVTRSRVNSGASYDVFTDVYDKRGKLVEHAEKLW